MNSWTSLLNNYGVVGSMHSSGVLGEVKPAGTVAFALWWCPEGGMVHVPPFPPESEVTKTAACEGVNFFPGELFIVVRRAEVVLGLLGGGLVLGTARWPQQRRFSLSGVLPERHSADPDVSEIGGGPVLGGCESGGYRSPRCGRL